MNKRILAPIAGLLMVALVTGCSAADTEGATQPDGEVFNLTFASHVDETNYHNVAMEWWSKEVEERSDGRITIEPFYSESLCPFVEVLACVADGRADLGSIGSLNHPSELPSGTVVGIPFQSNNQEALALAMRDLYQENEGFREEWQNSGVVPLVFAVSSKAFLGSPFPIESIDDLAGHTTRGTGYLQQAVSAIDMTPAQMSFSELYEALDRGAIDTWITSIDGSVSGSLYEVTDHFVDIRTGGYNSQVNPAINASLYGSLPEDLRDIIDEVSTELQAVYAEEFFVRGVESDCAAIMPEISSFTALSDSDVESWERSLGSDAEDQWLQDAAAAGVQDPQALLDDFRAFIEEEEANVDSVEIVDICNSIQ